jgi:hypothetical protein
VGIVRERDTAGSSCGVRKGKVRAARIGVFCNWGVVNYGVGRVEMNVFIGRETAEVMW